jgi:hypothetical protein
MMLYKKMWNQGRMAPAWAKKVSATLPVGGKVGGAIPLLLYVKIVFRVDVVWNMSWLWNE